MKIDMEIMYVPVANIYQLREMMDNWKRMSGKVSLSSYICGALSVFLSALLIASGDEYVSLNLGSAAMFFLCGFLSKRWYYSGYICSFIAFVLGGLRIGFFPFESNIISVLLFIICAIPMFFAYRCMYNYRNVFLELKKRKGFPNFIANTADLLGEKMYLRDKKFTETQSQEEIYQEYVQAGYHPFKSDDELREEEFARQQQATVTFKTETTVRDIETDEQTRRKILLDEAKKDAVKVAGKYKYGQKVFGKELIFLHNDIHTSSIDDKRTLMWKWRNNADWATQNFFLFTFLMMLANMCSGLGTFIGFLSYSIILVFILGTDQMKMNKWYAPIATFIAIFWSFSMALTGGAFSLLFVIAAYLVNPGMLIAPVRYILNYRIYKELSKEEGFPSFIRTNSDMFADKMYIVEKREPIKKKDPTKRVVKVMDIGFDEPAERKDEGAWNAFDYMDGTQGEDE